MLWPSWVAGEVTLAQRPDKEEEPQFLHLLLPSGLTGLLRAGMGQLRTRGNMSPKPLCTRPAKRGAFHLTLWYGEGTQRAAIWWGVRVGMWEVKGGEGRG